MKPAKQHENFVKVHMPGEWPWVYRMKEEGETLIGRVDNHLLCSDMHGYQMNDVVEFEWKDGCWEAVKKLGLAAVPRKASDGT